MGLERAVPIAVKVSSFELDVFQFGAGDPFACRIKTAVQRLRFVPTPDRSRVVLSAHRQASRRAYAPPNRPGLDTRDRVRLCEWSLPELAVERDAPTRYDVHCVVREVHESRRVSFVRVAHATAGPLKSVGRA